MKKVVLINSELMGDVPEEVGKKLIASFLRKLCINNDKPHWIVFYGSGVRLLAEGSHVLDALEVLHSSGVELIACGTCVRYYELGERIAAGRVSSMDEIVSIIMKSDDVVSIC